MNVLLRRLVRVLPPGRQQSLRQRYLRFRMRNPRYHRANLPEYDRLADWVRPGDWAIDIGANIGVYTSRLAELVGPAGRVIAVEPVPETFSILANVVADRGLDQVTLLNAAVGETTQLVGMDIPRAAGFDGYYLASVGPAAGGLNVLCLSLDALNLPQRVAFVKVDAEGHELPVLRGMAGLLRRDRPTLLVEVGSDAARDFLAGLGYRREPIGKSPNALYVPGG
jgi:FkbM family methyltransferase